MTVEFVTIGGPMVYPSGQPIDGLGGSWRTGPSRMTQTQGVSLHRTLLLVSPTTPIMGRRAVLPIGTLVGIVTYSTSASVWHV
jgi:hypothetical protein